MYKYSGTLIKVVDGDTVDVQVDLGFSVFHNQRFRLNRVDTPELRGESLDAGKASKTFLMNVLPTGRGALFIECVGRDKYGRWICEITFANSESITNVSDLLVESGHATYVNY